jgi:hypothetical protein
VLSAENDRKWGKIGVVGAGERKMGLVWGKKKMLEPAGEGKPKTWGGGSSWKKDGFRVRFFSIFLWCCQNCPPSLKNQCSLVYIEKVLLGFQTSPSTFPFLLFSSFFVNFDFSYFLYFWKRANINIDSMRKINDFKINALKVERVPNIFENLNSF